jgi:hypothetical protein
MWGPDASLVDQSDGDAMLRVASTDFVSSVAVSANRLGPLGPGRSRFGVPSDRGITMREQQTGRTTRPSTEAGAVARLSTHQRRIGSFAAAEAYWRHYGQRHHRGQQAGSARRAKAAGRAWRAKPNIVTATMERREWLTREVVPFRPQVGPRVRRRGAGRPAGSRRAPRVAGRGGDSGDGDGSEGEPGEARHLAAPRSYSLAVERWSWSS